MSLALNSAQQNLARVIAGKGPDSGKIFEYLIQNYSGSEFTLEDLKTDNELNGLINPPKVSKAKKSSRGAKSSEERNREGYDPERCDARVWLNGYGGQCTHTKDGESTLCKHHSPDGKWGCTLCDENGKWWLGLVTEPRPENPVRPGGSGKPKVWKTSESGEILEKPMKPKKPKMTDEEKQKKKAEKAAEKEALKEQKKSEREALKEQKKKEKEEEKEKKKAEREASKGQKKKKGNDEDSEFKIKEHVEEVENSNGTITEIHRQELIPKVEEQETLSDEEQEESEYDEIVYEGIEYQCHKESKEVLDPDDFSVMGTWNTKTESIVWEDDDAESQHDNKVREMNGVPIPKKENK